MTGKLKKVLLPNLPYLLFAWLFDKLCQAVRLSPGADASEKLLRIAQGFTEAFASLWLSLHPLDLLLGAAGAALVRLAVYLKAKNAKKYRRGVEYGSARWGRPEDIAPYIDPVPDWNIPLTRTESLTMTSRPPKRLPFLQSRRPRLMPSTCTVIKSPCFSRKQGDLRSS